MSLIDCACCLKFSAQYLKVTRNAGVGGPYVPPPPHLVVKARFWVSPIKSHQTSHTLKIKPLISFCLVALQHKFTFEPKQRILPASVSSRNRGCDTTKRTCSNFSLLTHHVRVHARTRLWVRRNNTYVTHHVRVHALTHPDTHTRTHSTRWHDLLFHRIDLSQKIDFLKKSDVKTFVNFDML